MGCLPFAGMRPVADDDDDDDDDRVEEEPENADEEEKDDDEDDGTARTGRRPVEANTRCSFKIVTISSLSSRTKKQVSSGKSY